MLNVHFETMGQASNVWFGRGLIHRSTFFVELQNEGLKKEVPEVSCGAVLLGLIKCSSEQSTFLLVPCCFPHRMELSCGVRNEPLVPHVREGGRPSPGLIVSIPVEELGCFYKLRGVAVSCSCVAWKTRVFCVCEFFCCCFFFLNIIQSNRYG